MDYEKVRAYKRKYLQEAFQNFSPDSEYETFKKQEWVYPYAVFLTLKRHNGMKCWNEWKEEHKNWIKDRAFDISIYEAEICFEMFVQYEFYRQWKALKNYANVNKIEIMGDIPFYVGLDSLDVWMNQDEFLLGADGKPTFIAGVPPDYFSKDGQRWGNPLYNWEAMRADGFAWWRGRLSHSLKYCGLMRVDHFRGLCAYWEIPASEPTAQNGCWRPALGREMLEAFHAERGLSAEELPLIAEDLGIITDDVRALMEDFSLPGMKVLMFAFGGDVADNPYAPHNLRPRSAVYTGTHDNDTAVGWWRGSSTVRERINFAAYAGQEVTRENVSRVMAHMALASVAEIAVLPAQDILGLDGSCRMNRPAEAAGNWGWRLLPAELDSLLPGSHGFPEKLRSLNILYGRFKEVN